MLDIVIVCAGCGFSPSGNFTLHPPIAFVVNSRLSFSNSIFTNPRRRFGEASSGVVASPSRVASFGSIFLKYDLTLSSGLNRAARASGAVDASGNARVDVVASGASADARARGVASSPSSTHTTRTSSPSSSSSRGDAISRGLRSQSSSRDMFRRRAAFGGAAEDARDARRRVRRGAAVEDLKSARRRPRGRSRYHPRGPAGRSDARDGVCAFNFHRCR